MNAVIGALLPLIVTLALGFFAAWRHDFTSEQALVLNRMVLLYALPLLLFAGTVPIKRSTLTSDLGLAAAIAAAMVGAYLGTFLIVRFALHRPPGVSALTALAVGGPAIPFAGVVVLGYLYAPSVSAVPVAVGALVFNVIEVPVTLVLLSVACGILDRGQRDGAASRDARHTEAGPPAGAGADARLCWRGCGRDGHRDAGAGGTRHRKPARRRQHPQPPVEAWASTSSRRWSNPSCGRRSWRWCSSSPASSSRTSSSTPRSSWGRRPPASHCSPAASCCLRSASP